MEDVKDLIGRLMNHVDGSSFSDEELKRQINAIYSIYASIMGSEQIIVQASRYNALKYKPPYPPHRHGTAHSGKPGLYQSAYGGRNTIHSG